MPPFIIALLLTSCTSSKFGDLRDVPVSEITLAEPQVAEAKVTEQIRKLRADPSKKRVELAAALAELSMVHRELRSPDWVDDAKQAARMLDTGDKNSRAYFLTRRALFFAMNQDGQHGVRIIKPLLDGSWSDLDKAQIYNDLGDNPYFASGYRDFGDYAVRALKLRAKAAGHHSLEVAESLITFTSPMCYPGSIDKALCAELQLPASVASTAEEMESLKSGIFPPQSARGMAAMDKRRYICLRRAAQIREDILGSASLRLSDALCGLGEAEKLRAVAIYEKNYGSESQQVAMTYSLLAATTKDPVKAQEFAKKASVGFALLQAGNDPFKKAYVYFKGSLPGNQHQDRQDLFTRAYQSLGGNPPDMKGPETRYDAVGWVLDLKKLSIPELDWLTASTSTSFDSDLGRNQLVLEGLKGKRSVFRMDLPTWGGDGEGTEVKVIGKGRIRFRQEGVDAQDYQQVDYKWNGKTFKAIAGKPGAQDAKKVNSAIDDAVSGIWSYGIRGHHALDHDLVNRALSRANATAQKLFEDGNANAAADRLWIMFELTSDLVHEASTGSSSLSEVDDSKDDVQKWIRAWSYKGTLCDVNMTEKEWQPYLKNYVYFREKAGQQERARKVLQDQG